MMQGTFAQIWTKKYMILYHSDSSGELDNSICGHVSKYKPKKKIIYLNNWKQFITSTFQEDPGRA